MYIPPAPGFRGFVWEPSSEQDVVVLFGRLVERGDLALAIDYSWTAFPDCIATDTATGGVVNIEFEFRSSNFWSHRVEWRQLKAADPSAHWWVVSWHDDLSDIQRQALPGLSIVALRERVRNHDRAHDEKTVLNWYDGAPDDALEMFEWRSAGLATQRRETLRRLKEFGRNADGFSLDWPSKPDLPWFTVRHMATDIECFKVHANGRIGFPFHRWRSIPAAKKTEMLAALNGALATTWFTGREERKKGCDAAWLLHDSSMIDAFLAVWQQDELFA